ncbi:hypothetical protein D3C81_716670 [compost metagenome]
MLLQAAAKGKRKLRDRRQIPTQLGEHRLKPRNHKFQQKDHDKHGHHADDQRISHRRLHLFPRNMRLFKIHGQPLQRLLHAARLFTRTDHVHEDRRKDPRVRRDRPGECIAFAKLGRHFGQRLLQRFAFRLLRQDRGRLNDGNTRLDHRGELPAKHDELLVFDRTS